jgi:hypothetical protein
MVVLDRKQNTSSDYRGDSMIETPSCTCHKKLEEGYYQVENEKLAI